MLAIQNQTVAVVITAHGTVSGCHWTLRGKKNHGYLELRLVRDSCSKGEIRFRAAGVGVVSGFHAGNWIDKIHQLTSINIAPDVYANYGFDKQLHWHKGARHRGRVKFVSLDNGAG